MTEDPSSYSTKEQLGEPISVICVAYGVMGGAKLLKGAEMTQRQLHHNPVSIYNRIQKLET